VVVPSFWLKHLAEQSPLLKGKRIVHIPHGIDLNKYRPSIKSNAKERLGIPPQAHTIAFIAQKLKNNFFKGGADLLQILQFLNANATNKIHVLLMGEDHMPELLALKNLIIHEMGYVKEESKMVSILNATDVFVYPTRADNFPLVLLEATACGVPSVTFDVGGCGEIVQDQSTGYVIDGYDTTLAAQKVLGLLHDEKHLHQMSLAARQYAEEYFSSTLNAQRYHELFQEL
jgi:glycosyltransferase involved in cell wall biosynthesis